jgi:hypothetical protein
MKKNIVILTLVLVSIFSLLYANRERIRSAALVELSTACQTEADRQRQIAEQASRDAQGVRQLLAKALLEAEKQRLATEEQLRK